MDQLALPFGLYAVFALVLGLLIGSFLNVVIHRVPRGASIIWPGSHCPDCSTALRAWDNIPLLSFALLRGRCRQCAQAISWRYPAIELLTGLLFLALICKTGPHWDVLLEMTFAGALIALIFIDAKHHLLPNVIIYPAFVFALAAATLRAGWGQPISYAFDLSFIFSTTPTEFPFARAAWIGGFWLALAAPGFWLLDLLDLWLYDKYFDWEEDEAELPATGNAVESAQVATGNHSEAETSPNAAQELADNAEDEASERRYRRTILATMAAGLALALTWAGTVIWLGPNHPQNFEDAYYGLSRACAGALVSSMPIWWLRALYFFIRRSEGMGLGDVKLMAVIGAFLGWQGAFSSLLLASIGGAFIGAILAWRSERGLKTALPFGVCLGVAALLTLLLATPFFRWYIAD